MHAVANAKILVKMVSLVALGYEHHACDTRLHKPFAQINLPALSVFEVGADMRKEKSSFLRT